MAMDSKSDILEQAELGRSKYDCTPAEHLKHLLNIGWDKDSFLIQKYVRKNDLQEELANYG